MSLVRGRVLVPLRAFVKEAFGDLGWRRLLAELPPPHREILDGLIVPLNWYDREIHGAFLEAVLRLWGDEVPDVGRRMGARAAEHHVRSYLRPLIRLGGPMRLMERAASVYRDNFQGVELGVIERRSQGARLELLDPFAPPFFCGVSFPAAIEAMVRLAGATTVTVVQPVCRHTGAERCEIDVEWR
jgi:uncharacterized protein (TIGR02265 family)